MYLLEGFRIGQSLFPLLAVGFVQITLQPLIRMRGRLACFVLKNISNLNIFVIWAVRKEEGKDIMTNILLKG